MDWASIFSFFMHLDTELQAIATQYQGWTYAILFAVIFCETGLVVTPFLPGDSLLFAVGLVASKGNLNVIAIFLLLALAALCGDNSNYFIGRFFGERLFRNESSKVFKRSHLDRTHAFFEKYGGRTVILARFVPIVRTFSPFVAGMGKMTYVHFLAYSVVGAILWVGICVFAGFFFANVPIVRDHFSLAALAVVAISLLPPIIEIIKHRKAKKN
jgi:membrane-associated protein